MTEKFLAEQIKRLMVLPGREFDDTAMDEYVRILGRLSETALRYAIDRAVEEEMFVPPPSKVLEYARLAPQPVRPAPTADGLRGGFWESATQAQHTQAVVKANPRREGEPPIQYIERIAILAGLMPAEHAVRNQPQDLRP